MKNISAILIASLLSGVITLGAYKVFFENQSTDLFLPQTENGELTTKAPLRNVNYTGYAAPDFWSFSMAIKTPNHESKWERVPALLFPKMDMW